VRRSFAAELRGAMAMPLPQRVEPQTCQPEPLMMVVGRGELRYVANAANVMSPWRAHIRNRRVPFSAGSENYGKRRRSEGAGRRRRLIERNR